LSSFPTKKNYRIQNSKMSAEKYLGRGGGWENLSCRGGGSAFQIHSSVSKWDFGVVIAASETSLSKDELGG
jgi:hypothetical protein